ncbi:hypothetical protein K439DRAFT_1619251 [Ramaria rubella]|nr:hypothetical protein K439DRAFT_1619251 [Ramaria rubella]
MTVEHVSEIFDVRRNKRLSTSLLSASIVPNADFDDLPDEEAEGSIDWDEPWKHFEAALNGVGHPIYWWDSRIPGLEDTPTRHDADNFPPPADPFWPLDTEALAAYPLGHTPIRYSWRLYPFQRKVHPGYDRFGRRIIFKAIKSDSSEFSIAVYLARQRRLHSDPRDHTIPFLDIIKVGKWAFLVMPEWTSRSSPFNVGEYMNWFENCLEVRLCLPSNNPYLTLTKGLSYMHDHIIAFRDVSCNNILWNYGGDYAPRTGQPFQSLFDARYAYIDFGQSTQFPRGTPLEMRKVKGTVRTKEFSPPELSDTEEYDPFAVDVFALGRFMQLELATYKDVSPVPTTIWHSLPGLSDVLSHMTNTDPSNRPTASQALSKFRELLAHTPQEVLMAPGCNWYWGRLTQPGYRLPAKPLPGTTPPDFWRWTEIT